MNPGTKATAAVSAVRSMTGYAEARAEYDGWSLRVALRSVNHRFLDLRVRIPDGFEALEPVIRQSIREHLRRGHVEVTLHVDTAREASVKVNREVAIGYLHALEELRRDFGSATGAELVALLRLPGVVAASGVSGGASNAGLDEEEIDRLGEQVAGCLQEALGRLDEMRQAEGRSLAEEMCLLVAAIRGENRACGTTYRAQPPGICAASQGAGGGDARRGVH